MGRRYDENSEPFVLTAAAACPVLALGIASTKAGETRSWVIYLLLGSVFPVLLLALARFSFLPLKRLLLAFGVGLLLWTIFRSRTPLGLTAGALLAMSALYGARRSISVPQAAVWIVLCFALACAGRTSFARPIGRDLSWPIGAFLLSSLLLFQFLGERRRLRLSGAWAWGAVLVGLFVLGVASLRPRGIDWGMLHHWSFYAGPAELVRQGKWLLWEVPSQYGFLSVLSLAVLPTPTTWEALEIVNGSVNFFAAAFVFVLLFRSNRTLLGAVLALLTSGFAVFLVPGYFEGTSGGPWRHPGHGAYRFIWVYVMLAVSLWEAHTLRVNDLRLRRATLLLGSALFVMASLWSFESFSYAFACWIPALFWSRYCEARAAGPSSRSAALRRAASSLCVPAGLLAFVLLGLAAYYWQHIGTVPDFRAYVEFAKAYSTTFATKAIGSRGVVWALGSAFLVVSAALLAAFRNRQFAPTQVVALAAWGAAWSASSRYMARALAILGYSLVPIFLAAFACLLVAFSWQSDVKTVRALRTAVAPFLFFLLFSTLLNEPRLTSYGEDLAKFGSYLRVADRLPPIMPEQRRLMETVGIGPGDPVLVLSGRILSPVWEVQKSGAREARVPNYWLPVAPLAQIAVLSPERRQVYLERWWRRELSPGWVMFENWETAKANWLLGALLDRYDTTQRLRNRAWTLLYLVPKAAAYSPAQVALGGVEAQSHPACSVLDLEGEGALVIDGEKVNGALSPRRVGINGAARPNHAGVRLHRQSRRPTGRG
jgi:hypothetical protein